MQDAAKKARLEGIRAQITDAETNFEDRAGATELHLVAKSSEVQGSAGSVTVTEMEQLYDRRMARQNSKGRAQYDRIMIAAAHGQCPFCGHLPVSTLDHCLPKAKYPALAVTPLNLIPCCKDCNHSKGTQEPTSADTHLLNAYFDDITGDRWLFAEIVETSPPGARFYVSPPDSWNATTTARVRRHFSKLKLAKLYASQSGRQLQNIRRALSKMHSAGGPDIVSKDLLERSESCIAVSRNTWEGALFEAASKNEWYCNGGFDH
jgi:hypothetical protein